ncbi:histidine phosphatase family protein [Nocardioides sp. 1609]|uniref:histidine phosphatase family protein n=1 Tax=Nocardioides sp. 1609 TaxID=2508327 RepID=UPI001430E96E|nr:histidine phosphatase family protein [Nocardioides sp. 1609]
MVTELYLIRHGEAVSNVEPVIAGVRSDQGLTERGRRQSALLEKRLRAEPLRADVLYVSSLRRALETGEYVARALGLPAQVSDDLHELRPGDADGLTVDEWRARAEHEVPPDDPFQPFSPGGESWATFLLRAETTLLGLVDAHQGQTVVAVCHGGVLEASFNLAFGRGPSARDVAFDPLNTSLTQWRHRRGPRGESSWTLVRFNDAGHLAGHLAGQLADESPRPAVPTRVDDRRTPTDQ